QHLYPTTDAALDLLGGLDQVAVDVQDAEGEVLRERILLEHGQEVEGAVGDGQVQVVDGEVEEPRVDGLECSEARVDDVVGGEPVAHLVHGLDGEGELLGPDGQGRLVDLHDPGPRLQQGLQFPPDLAGQRQTGRLPV